MDRMDIIFITFAIVSLLIAIALVCIYRRKTESTINKLNHMLDNAISGSFSESTYDESTLSALEAKLNRFLCMSLSSEKDIAKKKGRIEALISDISHQTKTPVANILLYSQLLQEQERLPNDCYDMVSQITGQSEKLNFLIQALVKTSRLETGIISVLPKSDSVLDLLSTVCNEIKKKAEEKNIIIQMVCEDSSAVFDKKWTEEALYNILDNAVKYTPNGGNISVSAIPYELFCRIDITDNGIGIAEQDITSIFQRFYRSIVVSQYEGVGIGLFLAREIITAEGGYIKVSSAIGKGSTFSVFLPKEK